MTQTPKRTHLTLKQHFQACEAMKKHKDRFLNERPTRAVASRILSELCGFYVSPGNVDSITDCSKVEWRPRRLSPTETEKKQRFRTLTTAIFDLYLDLGKTPSKALADLHRAVTGEGRGDDSFAASPTGRSSEANGHVG